MKYKLIGVSVRLGILKVIDARDFKHNVLVLLMFTSL